MDEQLENAKSIAYNNFTSFNVVLSDIVMKLIPEETKAKLKIGTEIEENSFRTLLGNVIGSIITREEFEAGVAKNLEKVNIDHEKLYALLTINESFDSTTEAAYRLIAEAETPESAKDVMIQVTDILKKENIPNIVDSIASIITKEVKKSNAELDDIETKETELNINTDNSGTALTDDPLNIVDDTLIEDDEPESKEGEGNASDPDASHIQTDDVPDSTDPEEEDDTENKAIQGEEGELYSEAVRYKYAECLNTNIVYRLRNAVSKYYYNIAKDNPEGDKQVENTTIAIAHALVILGIFLSQYGIMEPEVFAAKAEKVFGDNDENQDN